MPTCRERHIPHQHDHHVTRSIYMIIRTVPLRAAAVAVGIGVALAACGDSPTDSAAPAPAIGGEEQTALEAVYAEVDGLEGQERFDKLLELAKAQGDGCGYYHAGNQEKDVAAFQEATGLKIEDFQATSERVAERVVNEDKANQVGSSVILGSAADLTGLVDAGVMAVLDTPALEYVDDRFKTESWVAPISIIEMPTYNTSKVDEQNAPKSWEEFFTEFDGRKGVEITSWPWFATLVQQYFVEQKGMSEEEAMEMISNGLRGASTVDGNTLVPSLLASGEFDYVPNVYAHTVPKLVEAGAPLTYIESNPDMPPSIIALSMGLPRNAPNPACGLLFLEWSLSEDGQNVIASKNYVPTSSTYNGDTLLEQYPNAMFEKVLVQGADVHEEWKAKWDKVLREAGTQAPIKKDG
jgi:iron(III) transport system substrate-binding protein